VQSGEGDIVTALLALERDKASGALDFRAQGVLTRVFVDGGVPVFAEAGVLGETLGHVLVRENIISGVQFAAVVRKMTDAIVDDENVRFGEVLIELGILSREELDRVLAAQVEKKIIGCIPRGPGEWTFDASRTEPPARHPSPIRALLVDAAKLLPESRVEAILHLGEDRYPCLHEGLAQVAEGYGLESQEVIALGSVDGTRSTKAVLRGAKEMDALLAALVMGGSVELLATPRDRTEIIAPAPVSATGRRRAFRAKLVAQHKGKEAVERIAKDLESRPSLPPPKPTPKQTTLLAEDEFQAGRRLFLQEKLQPARERLAAAVEREPMVPLYRLYEELVASRIAGKFADAAATKKLATQLAKEDAECAFAFYALAYVALEETNLDAAKRFFRHAFKLDHELVDAGRQARLLEMRKETHGLAVPTPLREIMPRPAPDVAHPSPAAKSTSPRTMILAGVLGVVIVLAIVTLVLLRR
jgi:tetratricopeptide (TPR) repeat protein